MKSSCSISAQIMILATKAGNWPDGVSCIISSTYKLQVACGCTGYTGPRWTLRARAPTTTATAPCTSSPSGSSRRPTSSSASSPPASAASASSPSSSSGSSAVSECGRRKTTFEDVCYVIMRSARPSESLQNNKAGVSIRYMRQNLLPTALLQLLG